MEKCRGCRCASFENSYFSCQLAEITEYAKLEGSELNAVKEVLAFEVTKLIHGEEEATKAQEGASALFGAGVNTDNMPSTELTDSDFADGSIGILDIFIKDEISSIQRKRVVA